MFILFVQKGIEVLEEVMTDLKKIGAEKKLEVYVDGGIRRGTDVFKALALGATAVGIGRPTLYGLAAYLSLSFLLFLDFLFSFLCYFYVVFNLRLFISLTVEDMDKRE